MFARVRIYTKIHKDIIYIPKITVIKDNGDNYVLLGWDKNYTSELFGFEKFLNVVKSQILEVNNYCVNN